MNRKYRFEDLTGDEVLEGLRHMPIKRWSYRTEGEQIRHIGPTAQDFSTAFGLGSTNIAIGTVDADGVALAAAKALDQKANELERNAKEQRRELGQLRSENAALKDRLDRLERILAGQPAEKRR